MRKILLLPLALLLTLLVLGVLTGITPAFVVYGPAVATGIGSKLLCSAEHIMGNSRQQAYDDLVQYSPILAQLSIDYDEQARSVSTSLFGLSAKTASYIPGLGCAVDYPGYAQRQQIRVQPVMASSAPWPTGSEVATIDAGLQALLEEMVTADNAAGLNTRALLLAHAGRIVGEAYAQEADAQTPLLGWSMAKSLTSIMLGNLELRGLLDLRSQPGFDDWAGDQRARIGIEDLLTMTDGLDFSEQYDPGDDATAMLFTVPGTADYALARPAARAPGETFSYSSGTANLLSRLYLDTLGSPQAAYDDFMANIYRPLGFQNAVFETDASGMFVGSSYFYASARDWARMGQLMLNGGIINGQRVLSPDWVVRATSPNQSQNDRAYGYQWWLNAGNEQLRFETLPADAFYANGNRQQLVMVIPSRQAVIVRLGWTADAYPVADNFARLLQALQDTP